MTNQQSSTQKESWFDQVFPNGLWQPIKEQNKWIDETQRLKDAIQSTIFSAVNAEKARIATRIDNLIEDNYDQDIDTIRLLIKRELVKE